MKCSRRVFLSAGGALALQACAGGATYRAEEREGGEYIVPLSVFAENDSVQVKHRDFRAPIGISRIDGEFIAVEMICPHQNCVVNLKEDQYACPCHGSTFELDGTVTRGPSIHDLSPIQVREDAAFLALTIRR